MASGWWLELAVGTHAHTSDGARGADGGVRASLSRASLAAPASGPLLPMDRPPQVRAAAGCCGGAAPRGAAPPRSRRLCVAATAPYDCGRAPRLALVPRGRPIAPPRRPRCAQPITASASPPTPPPPPPQGHDGAASSAGGHDAPPAPPSSDAAAALHAAIVAAAAAAHDAHAHAFSLAIEGARGAAVAAAAAPVRAPPRAAPSSPRRPHPSLPVPNQSAAEMVAAAQAAGQALELTLTHLCAAPGCPDTSCTLCSHTPSRRCAAACAKKYWVGDPLTAACGGGLVAELRLRPSGARVAAPPPNVVVELAMLDGYLYALRTVHGGQSEDALAGSVVAGPGGVPVLVAGAAAVPSSTGGSALARPRPAERAQPTTTAAVCPFVPGLWACAPLHGAHVALSSENMLPGTKRAPLRLLATLIDLTTGDRVPGVSPAVSEEFVVVARRAKNVHKQAIPSLDDPVSRLHHVGKETVAKLRSLGDTLRASGVRVDPSSSLSSVTRVADFVALAAATADDPQLAGAVRAALKLPRDKWMAACDHAATAVPADDRLRVWRAPGGWAGLLFGCRAGCVQLDAPLAVLHAPPEGSPPGHVAVGAADRASPAQRAAIVRAARVAVAAWQADGHPGWSVLDAGGRACAGLADLILSCSATGGLVPPPAVDKDQGQVRPRSLSADPEAPAAGAGLDASFAGEAGSAPPHFAPAPPMPTVATGANLDALLACTLPAYCPDLGAALALHGVGGRGGKRNRVA